MTVHYKRFTTNPDLDINFFAKIDSESKAYILGMLYADGSLCPYINKYGNISSYKLRLRLAQTDEQIVRDISVAILGYDNVTITQRPEKNWQPIAGLQIGNKKIGEDLIKLGCGPNKSSNIRLPTFEQVPQEFYHHFIRGFFDGDGCVGSANKAVASFTSNEIFCEQLRDFLSKNANLSFKEFCNRKNGYGSIVICGRDNIYNLYKYLYKNANIYMSRKNKKMKECILFTKRTSLKQQQLLIDKYPFK